jgi:hypothetical protein
MSSWFDFAEAEADFADRVRQLFDGQRHMTLATLRSDGSPRISGTEASFEGGELSLAMMPGSLKAQDLLRDPRLALHSPTLDPPEGDPSSWLGDAKIAGRAVAVVDGQPSADPPDRFRVDITEVVLVKVGTPSDHLVIESWHPGGGLQVRLRR